MTERPLGELVLTVAVELGELVQVRAEFSWEMFNGFIQEAERGDGPAAWRQNQNLDLCLLI